MAAWVSFSKVQMSSAMVFSAAQVVLLFAKFSSSEFDIYRSRSFVNILNKIGPSIDLWGTSESKISKKLRVSFILKFCFRLSKVKESADSFFNERILESSLKNRKHASLQ